jgi:hypothetical protein
LRYPEGPEIGLKILDFSTFDPEDQEVSEIWDGPRFDVPVLDLKESTAGENALAVVADSAYLCFSGSLLSDSVSELRKPEFSRAFRFTW